MNLYKAIFYATIIYFGVLQLEAQNTASNNIIKKALKDIYNQQLKDSSGKSADYIPELARVPADLFGISVCSVDGKMYEIGDSGYKFSIQSISKVFTLALVMQLYNEDSILNKIGVNATGRPFNSIIAMEDLGKQAGNPLVNAGAIATTSLVHGDDYSNKWENILQTYSDFAGTLLSVNESVYRSEAATNQRNQAIAKLLQSYGKIYSDPAETVDLYTKQCAVNVNAHDLAVMAATLANAGINPISNKKVIEEERIPEILTLMATAGMYDNSGVWFYKVGLPAKSGVGGGIIAVVPGKYGIAAFSPRLDGFGNSVRAYQAIESIAREMQLNVFLGK